MITYTVTRLPNDEFLLKMREGERTAMTWTLDSQQAHDLCDALLSAIAEEESRLSSGDMPADYVFPVDPQLGTLTSLVCRYARDGEIRSEIRGTEDP